MAEIDPEKILAEFEAARAQVRKGGRNKLDGSSGAGSNKSPLWSILIIAGIAMAALWLLMIVLEQIPHHHRESNDPQTTQSQ